MFLLFIAWDGVSKFNANDHFRLFCETKIFILQIPAKSLGVIILNVYFLSLLLNYCTMGLQR